MLKTTGEGLSYQEWNSGELSENKEKQKGDKGLDWLKLVCARPVFWQFTSILGRIIVDSHWAMFPLVCCCSSGVS